MWIQERLERMENNQIHFQWGSVWIVTSIFFISGVITLPTHLRLPTGTSRKTDSTEKHLLFVYGVRSTKACGSFDSCLRINRRRVDHPTCAPQSFDFAVSTCPAPLSPGPPSPACFAPPFYASEPSWAMFSSVLYVERGLKRVRQATSSSRPAKLALWPNKSARNRH